MEKYKKGGYTILDLESSTIYADSVKALDSNKPIVVYDGTNKPYFADTITLSGTSVVITKGGKTITIANDNTITNVGDIQNHLYRYAVSFNQDDVKSGDTITAITLTNKILTDDMKIYDMVNIGDNIILEDFQGSAPSAIINDVVPSTKYVQITLNDGTDLEYNENSNIVSVTLIQQLF